MTTFADSRTFGDDRSNIDVSINQHYRQFSPHRLIRVGIIESLRIAKGGTEFDDLWRHGHRRPILSRKSNGVGIALFRDLIAYRMPSSATPITLGSVAADGTYTPTVYNQAIRWDGALAGAGDLASDIAGVLLSEYLNLEVGQGEVRKQGDFRAVTLSPGDVIWIVRSGHHYMRFGGAVTSGRHFISAASGIGNQGRTWAATTDGIAENVPGFGYSKVIGQSDETLSGAGIALCRIQLPEIPAVRP